MRQPPFFRRHEGQRRGQGRFAILFRLQLGKDPCNQCRRRPRLGRIGTARNLLFLQLFGNPLGPRALLPGQIQRKERAFPQRPLHRLR